MLPVLNQINAQISLLISGTVPQLTAFSWFLFNAIAVSQLVMIAIRWELELMDNHHWPRFHISDVFSFLIKVAVVGAMLTFYSSSLPGFGVNVHQLLPMVGQKLAATVNQTGDAALTNSLNNVMATLPSPTLLNPLEMLTYVLVLIVTGLFHLLMFVVTAFGFIAVGVLSITGQLVIPLLLTKNFAKYFWGWVDMMFTYSMYPFIGAAFIFVFSNSLNNFLMLTLAGGLTFPQLVLAFPVMCVLLGTFAFSIFSVPQFTSQHFGGAGATFAGMAGVAQKYLVSALEAAVL